MRGLVLYPHFRGQNLSHNQGSFSSVTQKIMIQPNNLMNDNAIQTLSNNRSLYIKRVNNPNSQGIYRLEVDVDSFPCINDNRRDLGGLNVTLNISDPNS